MQYDALLAVDWVEATFPAVGRVGGIAIREMAARLWGRVAGALTWSVRHYFVPVCVRV